MSVEWISGPCGMINEGSGLHPGPSQPSVPFGKISVIRSLVLEVVLNLPPSSVRGSGVELVATVAFAS